MTNSEQPATQRIKREAKIGFAVFLLLFGAFSYIVVDRVVSKFSFASNDFASVPLAQMIPPEDLPNVRNPDYVLPTVRSREIARQDSQPNPTRSVAPPKSKTIVPVTDETNTAQIINSNISVPKNSEIALSAHQEEIAKDDSFELNIEIPNKKKPAPMDSSSEPLTNPLSSPSTKEGQNDFQPRTQANVVSPAAVPPTSTSGSAAANSFESLQPRENGRPSLRQNAGDQDGTLPFQATFPQNSKRLPEPLNPPLPIVGEKPEIEVKETKAKDHDLPTSEDQFIIACEKDTLWDLATKTYGDGRFFAAVHAANKGTLHGETKLTAGMKLNFPAKAQLIRDFRVLIPQDILASSAETSQSHSEVSREYTTHGGDTLFSIAREELGQASRYVEILKLNLTQISHSTRHNDELAAGLKLKLPAK